MNSRTQVFDTVRKLMGRGFRQKEVVSLDAALDDIGEACCPKHMTADNQLTIEVVGKAGVELIKKFEGCARKRSDGMIEAYPDPGTGGEPWTIGWGATGMGLNGQRIGPGTLWSQAECDARLESDLIRYSQDVARAIGEAPTTQSQFDAMVSFHYNTGAIARATLTKKHIAGDYPGAAREFDRWNKAGGRVLKGLVRRRRSEKALYQT